MGISLSCPAQVVNLCAEYEGPTAAYARLGLDQLWLPTVDHVEPTVEDFQVLTLHNFYVRFGLPMMVEVQCFDWAEGVGPDSLPAD